MTDRVLNFLERSRSASTSHLPIGGGKGYPRDKAEKQAYIQALAEKRSLSRERVKQLFERNGTRAAEITAYLDKEGERPLAHLPGYTRGELQFLVEKEMSTRLEDLLLRRTKLAWGGQLTRESLAEAGAFMGDLLGWPEEFREAEISRTAALLREKHGLDI